MDADQIRSLQPGLWAWMGLFHGCFKREVSFEHAQHYILGLMADLKRKSIEPIALAANKPVRTLQEFLAFYVWDEAMAKEILHRRVALGQKKGKGGKRLGIIDASGHAKRGDKTPGVGRQYCGETGKIDNCVVGQHLLYSDNDPENSACYMLDSDLYLPASWTGRKAWARRKEAGIPKGLKFRTKWRIALDQVRLAVSHGIVFDFLVFDEDYGRIPAFWLGLAELKQVGVGEVPTNFYCWPEGSHGARRVDDLARHHPMFTRQKWKKVKIKDATRGPVTWEVRTGRVSLADSSDPSHNVSVPTAERYWLLVARNPGTGEVKYVVSNAPEDADWRELIRALFARWHVEKWFERGKQEVGLGAFEVRTYRSLMRHWVCAQIAMAFLAEQTQRLRGEKSADHLRAGGHGRQSTGHSNLGQQLEDTPRNRPLLDLLPKPQRGQLRQSSKNCSETKTLKQAHHQPKKEMDRFLALS